MAQKKPNKNSKSWRPSSFVLVLIAIAVVGLTAGIAGAVITRGDGDSGAGGSASIKIPEEAFSNKVPPGSAEAYQFAVDHPEYLAAVPCYCGCGEIDNHKSNLDCFIDSRNGDSVKFDDHALG